MTDLNELADALERMACGPSKIENDRLRLAARLLRGVGMTFLDQGRWRLVVGVLNLLVSTAALGLLVWRFV